ncbi:MAG: hypothetical protein U5L72_06760 [Bacteroidales bacterium]|nr:hypothetical protein [Bacteroidales bacterium]
MKTILITGIGGPTPRSIARTLRKHYPEYRLVGIDANPKALGFFMPGLVDKYYVAPRITKKEYWPFIHDLIKKEGIDQAFVQPEMEVIGWGLFYRDFKRFPCPVLIPPFELATTLMDKSKMSEALRGTYFIPRTVNISQSDPKFDEIEASIGFPSWIRAIKGAGGLGSLKVLGKDNLISWLLINRHIDDFTVSEYLPGRHLATEMLYFNGEYLKGASLECAEYVMASIAPSGVTGNTSFGRFLNEDHILKFCDECLQYICANLGTKAHGVLSFDLKEDIQGNLKVTEVNIRHMAYTGVMADVGFNLIEDTVDILSNNSSKTITRQPYFKYDRPYVFLRDVDCEPIVLESEDNFQTERTNNVTLGLI